jgi:hypothetical protein
VYLNPDANLTAFVRPIDRSKDPKRDPGPISVPRGVPTFFRAPIAHTPEDLKAGKVDVAFLGAPLDMGSGMRGAGWGPRGLRAFDPRPGGVGGGADDPPPATTSAAGGAVVSNVQTAQPATAAPLNPSGGSPNMHVMIDPFRVPQYRRLRRRADRQHEHGADDGAGFGRWCARSQAQGPSRSSSAAIIPWSTPTWQGSQTSTARDRSA